MKTSDWDHYLKEHEFWKLLGNDKPKRNYNTVRNLYLYIQKLLQEKVWDGINSYAVQYAFLNELKINKVVMKAMYTAAKQTYQ